MPKGGARKGAGRPKKEEFTPEKTAQRADAKRLRYLESLKGTPKGGGPGGPTGPRSKDCITREEKQAIRAMKWRVPAEAPEQAVELANEALGTIVKVMRQGVMFKHARTTLAAAAAVRDEVCGPIKRQVEVSGKLTYEQLVNASMVPENSLPPPEPAKNQELEAEYVKTLGDPPSDN
jgi:hypothetical protein